MVMRQDIHSRNLVVIMKVNYDALMMEEIKKLNGKKKILMHSCCGPCSTACIERLKEYFDITVVYYNPNIEPLDEYIKRKNEQIRALNLLGIKYMDCDYDNETYKKIADPLKDEPEGGKRCTACFALRLKKTATLARDNDFDYFTTTLTVSPHKNSELINKLGIEIGENVGVKFLVADFKKREGYKRSIELSKEFNLYRQNYCGCSYSKQISEEE